ncbi:MAG: SRPBCC family protein [Thermodesulfobacteriota bacterium]
MKLHVLERNLDIPVTLMEAWEFFSNPRNLPLITPPGLGFRMKSEAPERIYPGLMLTYTVTPFFGFPVDWVTEITQVREPEFFVDDQRMGPYRLWHHEHAFEEIRGGVRVRDLVHYALPFGPLGRIAHDLVVKKQLREIFDYRSAYLSSKFGRIS